MPDPTDAPTEIPTGAVPETVPAPDRLDILLAEWTHEFVHDSPVSRATEAYNHMVNVAVPALWRRLREIA